MLARSLVNYGPGVSANANGAVRSLSAVQPSKDKPAPLAHKDLPLSHFNVREKFNGHPAKKKILLIQDIHMNLEAQQNIANGLDELFRGQKVDLVAVEGAWGEFDFRPFREFPDRSLTRDISDAFLANGRMGGPSHAAVNCEGALPLYVGVDDREHYFKNVAAIIDAEKEREKIQPVLLKEAQKLARLKKAVLNPRLAAVDSLVSRYLSGSMEVGEYLSAILRETADTNAAREFKRNRNVSSFLEALRLERTIDFQKADRERKAVLSQLASKLNEEGAQELVRFTAQFQAGQLGMGEFYRELEGIFSRFGVALESSPEFKAYVSYVLMSDSVKADDLLGQIYEFSKSVLLSLARTPDEKALALQSLQTSLTDKLVRLAMTPREWEEYKSSGVRTLEAGAALAPFEQFYSEAEIRSHKMAENTLKMLSGARGPRPYVALFTGGFHSPQIAQILREHHVSYTIVSPKLTRIDDEKGTAYLSVFAREKSPLEELFESKPISVLNAQTHVGAGRQVQPAQLNNRYFRFFQSVIPQIPSQTRKLIRHFNGRQILVTLNSVRVPGAKPLAQPLKIGTHVVSVFELGHTLRDAWQRAVHSWAGKKWADNKVKISLAITAGLILAAVMGLLSPVFAMLAVGMCSSYLNDIFNAEEEAGETTPLSTPEDILNFTDPVAHALVSKYRNGIHIAEKSKIPDPSWERVISFHQAEAIKLVRDRIRKDYVEGKVLSPESSWKMMNGDDMPDDYEGLMEGELGKLLSANDFTVYWEGPVVPERRMLLIVLGRDYYVVEKQLDDYLAEETRSQQIQPEDKDVIVERRQEFVRELARQLRVQRRLQSFLTLILDAQVQVIFAGKILDSYGEIRVALLKAIVDELAEGGFFPAIRNKAVYVWGDDHLSRHLRFGADMIIDFPHPEHAQKIPFDAKGFAVPLTTRKNGRKIDPETDTQVVSREGFSIAPRFAYSIRPEQYLQEEASLLYYLLSEHAHKKRRQRGSWLNVVREYLYLNFLRERDVLVYFLEQQTLLTEALAPEDIAAEVVGDSLVVKSKLKINAQKFNPDNARFYVVWGSNHTAEPWEFTPMNCEHVNGEYFLSAHITLPPDLKHGGATICALPKGWAPEKTKDWAVWWTKLGHPDAQWAVPHRPQGAMGVWRKWGMSIGSGWLGSVEGALTSLIPPILNLAALPLGWGVLVVFIGLLLGHKFSGIQNPDGSINHHPGWGEVMVSSLIASLGFLGTPIVVLGLGADSGLMKIAGVLLGSAVGAGFHGGANLFLGRERKEKSEYETKVELARQIVDDVKKGRLRGDIHHIISRVEELTGVRSLGVGKILPNRNGLVIEWEKNLQGLAECLFVLLFNDTPRSSSVQKPEEAETQPDFLPKSGKVMFVIRSETYIDAKNQLQNLKDLPFWEQIRERKLIVDLVFPGLERQELHLLTHFWNHLGENLGEILFRSELDQYEKVKEAVLSVDPRTKIEAENIHIFIPHGGVELPLSFVQVLSDLQMDEKYKNRIQVIILESLLPRAWAVRLNKTLRELKAFTDLVLSNA